MAEEAAKRKDEKGKRAARATSNVFAAFSQSQIQEFKEAFTMIDQNRDGFIDIEDLKDLYASLGRTPPDSELKEMLAEVGEGPFNFTMFLSMFSDRLNGTDPEDTLRNAFTMFDPENKAYLDEAYIEDLLKNMGDNFTAEEIKQTWKEAPIQQKKFDYNKFVTIIKRGKEDQ
jgi:Ca2+-binding EF-hand superfamily protein